MFNGADLHGKAPSGRELAPQATEGECVTVKRFLLHRPVGSFRHATRATSLAEGGYRKVQLPDKSKFEIPKIQLQVTLKKFFKKGVDKIEHMCYNSDS